MTPNRRLHQGPAGEWWRPDLTMEVDERSGPAATAPPVSGVTFWALMGFSFVALVAPQEFFPVLAPLRIALLAAAAAVITYLWDRLVHRQPVTVLTREIWITAGLVGWAIVTVPLSYWPGGSVDFLLSFYFKSLVIFWLLANTVTTLTRLYQVAWGLSLMAAPVATTAVAHFVAGDFLPASPRLAVTRIVGYDAPLTGNPNDLALMLNLILPLSVALLLATRRPPLRAVLLGLVGLDVVAVILTFSRGGFLTLATVLFVYLWKIRRRPERRWAWAALLVVLVACVPLLPSRYVDRVSTITSLKSDTTGSAQLRWDDTVAAARFVLANPVVGAGVGMNVLALIQERGDNRWTAVHNVYLEYAVELGLPGLVLFLLLLGGCFRSVRFVQRRSVAVPALRDLFLLAEGLQVSLVAFTVAALFHPVAYHLYFYYFAALALTVKTVYAAETGYAPELFTLPSLSPNRTAAQPMQDATDARKEKPMKSPSVIRMLALSVLGLGLVFAASPVTAGVVDLQVNGSGTAGGTCQLPMVALSSGCTSNSGGDVTGALFGSGIYDLSLTAGNSVAVNSLGGVCLPADSVFKITTATGDLIHFKTVGWLCEEAFPSSNYHYNGTGRIDSGTGTFAAAAGGGNLAATFVKGIGGATFIRVTGTISY